jgi:hypothetical protein
MRRLPERAEALGDQRADLRQRLGVDQPAGELAGDRDGEFDRLAFDGEAFGVLGGDQRTDGGGEPGGLVGEPLGRASAAMRPSM